MSHRPTRRRPRGSASRSVATCTALLLGGAAHAGSPPDPSADIPWDEDATTGGAQTRFDGVDSVMAAFDNARRAEEDQFDLEAGSLGNLSLPAQADWDALDVSSKALAITNAERTARGGAPYPGGAPLGLPLAGVETHLDDLAQRYADYMVTANYWGHDAPADGPEPFAGTDPFSRIDNHPVLGEAPGGDCHQFLGQAENLAVFASSPGTDIPLPIERAIYGFIYDDAGSAWGHRHLMLLQDEPLRGGSGGYTNDAGGDDSEGFMGVGTAGSMDGGYAAFDDVETFPVQRNVVMLFIDPVPGDACGYESSD